MERLSVDDMKAIELDIMDEIDRVCAAHGVEYFLGYGTLLGAVRHGGFIPWDDDMDIVMMRDQYELLMDHFNKGASDRVIDVVGEGNPDKTYPKSLFKPVRVKFEDREYAAPAGAEEFLTIEYGDWRTPPAESDRAVHVMEAYRL